MMNPPHLFLTAVGVHLLVCTGVVGGVGGGRANIENFTTGSNSSPHNTCPDVIYYSVYSQIK